jgi:C-terminal processing protease CtpA/Prc
VWLETPTGNVPTVKGGYSYNGNREITLSKLQDTVACGKFALVGKSKEDGFGYFLMLRQSDANPADVKAAVDAIRALKDSPGFIVDIRTANGGSEPLALEIAQLFCSSPTVYAKSKYRNGVEHDNFGQVHERILPATEGAYTRPVVCLFGPGAVSSGEGFVKMMKCLPQVTTVGSPTRGASGNPKPFALSRTGVTVYFSRWVDMLPDGQPTEGVGIAPDIRVEAAEASYVTADPTLEKALEVLRAKVTAQP